MSNSEALHHEFVEFIPDVPDEGTLYVSIRFATVVHKCCCGCGMEVVTPLSPTDWKLIFDGKTISLDPSIGNWSLECQSHYWIIGSRVRWARKWSHAEIDVARVHRGRVSEGYASEVLLDTAPKDHFSGRKGDGGIMKRLRRWWNSG